MSDLPSEHGFVTGAKLNLDKTEGLLFGAWKSRIDLPVNLKWTSDCLTVLGCRVGNFVLPDWDSLVHKFKTKIKLWSSRSLSLQGRTLLANTLGLSTFWYQATIFDIPKTVVHALNKLLFPFLWNKNKEPIACSSAIAPRLRGGLSVVHVATKLLSLGAIWLRRLMLPPPMLKTSWTTPLNTRTPLCTQGNLRSNQFP